MTSSKGKAVLAIGVILLIVSLVVMGWAQNAIDYWESSEGQERVEADQEAKLEYENMLFCKTGAVLILLLGIFLVVVFWAQNKYR